MATAATVLPLTPTVVAGCAWQLPQLLELKVGPSPLFAPVTVSNVRKLACPSAKNSRSSALSEKSAVPAFAVPLRAPGSVATWPLAAITFAGRLVDTRNARPIAYKSDATNSLPILICNTSSEKWRQTRVARKMRAQHNNRIDHSGNGVRL